MRVLVFHGYLLEGTGSNVYNARLAAALAQLGHDVHLLSQDRHPERLPFVDAVGDWDSGALQVRTLRRAPLGSTSVAAAGGAAGGARGTCTVYRPNIGGLLPVYVSDRYEGIEARTFAQCADAQIAGYIDANVDAVRELCARVRPALALANHLVMGPVILARALHDEVPYAVKVHGSALEYTVKPEPHRFLGFAREGLAGARTVLVGSRHTASSLWRALADPGLARRTRLGPPGVDVERFAPREPAPARAQLRALTHRLGAAGLGVAADPRESGGEDDTFARDDLAAAAALARVDPDRDRLVAFVGKLIVSKGVDLLLAAWPLVLERVPAARLLVVGFGAYRDGLERLLAALAAGDIDQAREIARAGRSLESAAPLASAASLSASISLSASTPLSASSPLSSASPPLSLPSHPCVSSSPPAEGEAPLGHLLAFLGSLRSPARERYRSAARALPERVVFTGRLDHDELAELLPACEALVVPSTFPEAFGMVAAEAAACGALPISAAHSGLAEVAGALAGAVPAQVAPWLSFPVDDAAVTAIAERVLAWLATDPALRDRARAGLVATVRERWSWQGVARGVIAAARGELDVLAEP